MRIKWSIESIKMGTYDDGVTPRETVFAHLWQGNMKPWDPVSQYQQVLLPYFLKCQVHHAPLVNQNQSVMMSLADMLKVQQAIKDDPQATLSVFQIDTLPPKMIQLIILKQEQQLPDEKEIILKVGEERWNALLPFQRTGLQVLVSRKRAYCADDPGLGKTVQGSLFLYYFREQGQALVLAPTSLCHNWIKELEKWTDWKAGTDIQLVGTTKDIVKKEQKLKAARVIVVSIGLACRPPVQTFLLSLGIPNVLMDECHAFKAITSHRSKMAYLLAKKAWHVLCLSGTPFNYPSDMYQQLRILYDQAFTQFHHYGFAKPGEHYFADRYCLPERLPFGGGKGQRAKQSWRFKGYDRKEELHALLSCFMVRRKKTQVLSQLPDKIRIPIYLNHLPRAIQKQVDEKLQKMRASENKNNNYFMEAFRLTAQGKQEAVVEVLKDKFVEPVLAADRDARLLIFYHHNTMKEQLQALLQEYHIPFFTIAGDVSKDQRQRCVESFQTTNEYQVGLLSIMAAGVGLTLTKAHTVVFTEMLFGPDQQLQGEDRAHRIGQEHDVTVYYLLQPDSTDDIVWSLIQKKAKHSSHILDGQSAEQSAMVFHRKFIDDLLSDQ